MKNRFITYGKDLEMFGAACCFRTAMQCSAGGLYEIADTQMDRMWDYIQESISIEKEKT